MLRAAQIALDEELATPLLVGRPAVIETRIRKAGLRMKIGQDIAVVNPDEDPRFRQYWQTYHRIMGRRGVSPEAAKAWCIADNDDCVVMVTWAMRMECCAACMAATTRT